MTAGSRARVVVGDDALDVLELALGGAVDDATALAWLAAKSGSEVAGPASLLDSENTEVAIVELGPAGPRLAPGAGLARGGGPQWDPAVRRVARDVRDTLASGPAGAADRTVAVVVDHLPTRGDLDALAAAARARRTTTVLSVALVSRAASRSVASIGAAGLARAASATAEALASAVDGLRAIPVAVPWPADVAGLDLERVLGAFGADETIRVGDVRSAEDRTRVAGLTTLVEREVRDLYPAPFADEVLRATSAPRPRGGVVFFTGLSGSGKSTIARALADALTDGLPDGGRDAPHRVTLLDGDEVRRHLSADLGFDSRSRELNIERIAYVASIVARHGGLAIAVPIAPFDAGRRNARRLAEAEGAAFVLVHVSTPLEVCESRDRKGLYARARAGEIPEFTGITSPYEPPADADVVVDTSEVAVDDAVRRIRERLEEALSGGDATFSGG